MIRGFALVVLVTLWVTTGSFASAEEAPVRLGIEALESDQHYFDLTLRPGESKELTVRFSNYGASDTSASVYAADVYPVYGGGLGLRDVDEAETGATRWLEFPGQSLDLRPGEQVERSFNVTVPDDTGPGDYITSVVMQNADPVVVESGHDAQQFTQTVRHGVAVAIDVPGPREPELAIGAVSHDKVGGRSAVLFEIANPGNAHLKPAGEVAVYSAEDERLVERPVQMDSVYAGTDTRLEIFLDRELEPGDYMVSLDLTDEETGAEASVQGVGFSIPAPPSEPAQEAGGEFSIGGMLRSADIPGADGSGLAAWIVVVVSATTGLSMLIGIVLWRLRRPAGEPSEFAPATGTETAPGGRRTAQPTTTNAQLRTAGRETDWSARETPVRQLLPSKPIEAD